MLGIKKKSENFNGKRIFSVEDYLSIERNLPEMYEFWNGFVFELDKPDCFIESFPKLEKRIDKKLTDTSYEVFFNFLHKNKKVWVESENCLLYPDLFVVDTQDVKYYQDRKDTICNPFMIVEVATVDSMAIRRDQTFLRDRKEKLWMYQKIASLQEYVLITDNIAETVVETYQRFEKGCWIHQIFTKKSEPLVKFDSIGFQFSIADLYI